MRVAYRLKTQVSALTLQTIEVFVDFTFRVQAKHRIVGNYRTHRHRVLQKVGFP